MAPGAEEGREKLRKAKVRSTYPAIRRYPNGGTRLRKAQSLTYESIVCKRERRELKHLSSDRKRKKTRFPK